jgi:O-antigen/teichoic acid export membrane protein
LSTLKLSLVGLGARVANTACAMASVVVVARYLGPRETGEYLFFLRLSALLTVFADLGLSQSVNAFTGRHESWAGHIHRAMLRFAAASWIVTSLVGGCVLWLAGGVLLPEFPTWLAWLAFAILPLVLYANFWSYMAIGLGRIWRVNLVRVAFNLLLLLLTLTLVVGFSGGVGAAAAAYALAALAQSVVMFYMALRLGRGETEGGPPAGLRGQLLQFGLRSYPGAISFLLWTRIPDLLLYSFAGPSAVGIFLVAQQVVEKATFPFQAAQDVIYKKMSASTLRDAVGTTNRYLRAGAGGASALLLVGFAAMPLVVRALLGDAYAEAIPAARVLLLGAAFTCASLFTDAFFLCQLRRPGLLSALGWLNVVICFCTALWLIPGMAAQGAAWALAVTQIAGALIAFVIYLRVSNAKETEATVSGGGAQYS